MQEVKRTLKGKTLLNHPTSLTTALQTRPENKTVYYEDTCFSAWVGIGLVFPKKTERLAAITVMYIGVDPNSGKTIPSLQREVERLWTALRNRYGQRIAKEENTPFGVELSWVYPKATIKMLKTSFPKHALFLQYEPPQP